MITLRASYYQQFDADFDLEVPGEGYGGWCTADVEIDLEHTAQVVMHAWETGTREQYPGWYRTVPSKNKETARTEMGKLLALWRVSLAFGFVFDVDDFVQGLSS